MHFLLVDDEKLQLARLENELRKIVGKEDQIFSFMNPVSALNCKENFDVAFLDIEMPGLNGVALAKELKKTNPKINIIFVTAYNSYAIDAYHIHASGYILKPVNKEKIAEELNSLRYQIDEIPASKKLQVKCFGNFEVFYKGETVKFSYQKSKELFAYLIDREGSEINVNELNAILWEEDNKSYLRNLIADIQKTLKSIDCSDVFVKRRNGCCIDVSKIDCDAYEYKNNNPNFIKNYKGEYMNQYSWAQFNV